VQLVCPNGLPTLIPPVAHDLSEFQVLGFAKQKRWAIAKEIKKHYNDSHSQV
jgi:hypothetical protein